MTAQVLHKTDHMAAPGEARLPPSPARASVGSRLGEELAARLREIGAATGAPEDALEPALRATLEALGARAGALCVFDPRHELLWLAAEVGLSDDGCRALRNVRRGGAFTWDMPLHGVLNRRAYLIDSAAKNRYVPPLVEPANAVRTIACLPLYTDASPVGSLVLISLAPHALREQDIRTLTQPTRELVAMIEAVRKRASAATSASTAAAAAKAQPQPTRTPAAATIARKAAPEDAARIQQLTMALSKAEQERDRLAAALAAAGDERATTSRNQAALEARLVESTTELEWTRLKLADAESAAAKAHERACEAERERERAGVALDATTARERALQGELDAAATRSTTDDTETQALRVAEEARAAAVTELETTRQALSSAEAVVQALEQEATQAHAEITRLEQADVSNDLVRELAEARTREAEARARLSELDAEVKRLREESSALSARADEATRAHQEASRTHEETTRQAWEQERARLEQERARLDQELAQARAREEQGQTETRQLQAEVAALRASAAAAAREQDEVTRQELDRARAQLEHELEAARAREEQSSTRLVELEVEVGKVREERAALVANLETLAADRDRLREALEAMAAEQAAPELVIPALEEAALSPETSAALEEASAVETASGDTAEDAPAEDALPPAARSTPAPVRPAPSPNASGQPVAMVLDGEAGWEGTTSDRYDVVHVAPADVVAQAAALAPTHLIANLAAPGVFGALAELRAAGVTTPLWACLADPAANRAIALGRIEPALRPLDPDAVLSALGNHVGRGTKVVTIGTDVDALMSLRQIFSRQGLSVSMAWDVKQATDLLAMICPMLVVVDLEQPPRVGAGIVARLAGADPLPTTVLISSGEKDPAAGFRTALADPSHNHRTVTLARVLSQMINRAEKA